MNQNVLPPWARQRCRREMLRISQGFHDLVGMEGRFGHQQPMSTHCCYLLDWSELVFLNMIKKKFTRVRYEDFLELRKLSKI